VPWLARWKLRIFAPSWRGALHWAVVPWSGSLASGSSPRWTPRADAPCASLQKFAHSAAINANLSHLVAFEAKYAAAFPKKARSFSCSATWRRRRSSSARSAGVKGSSLVPATRPGDGVRHAPTCSVSSRAREFARHLAHRPSSVDDAMRRLDSKFQRELSSGGSHGDILSPTLQSAYRVSTISGNLRVCGRVSGIPGPIHWTVKRVLATACAQRIYLVSKFDFHRLWCSQLSLLSAPVRRSEDRTRVSCGNGGSHVVLIRHSMNLSIRDDFGH